MKSVWMRLMTVPLVLLFVMCAPVHLYLGALPHASHAVHHDADGYDSAFDHATDMSKVAFISILLLVYSFLTWFHLCVPVQPCAAHSPITRADVNDRSPPGIMFWLSFHTTSPPVHIL